MIAADYVTRRLMAPSHDGELVPVSLIHHRDTPIDGSAPCLLYGYGAYGIAIPASFNTNCLSLVDRGFVYAIAHIRGGKDKGYAWYEDGKREKKTNTFLDFIAAARHLVAERYTAHDRIIAQGGSAGGMLMGAIANMAPEAFGGIIAEVPFVDVLATMLDDTLPLTPPEWPEWGNPILSAEDYRTIAAYSPYDNVGAQDYPPILAVAGLTDPRVTYWEPAKWAARLRKLKTGDNPVLFKINMDAGHAGASGRFSRLEEIAYNYAFALKVAGKAIRSQPDRSRFPGGGPIGTGGSIRRRIAVRVRRHGLEVGGDCRAILGRQLRHVLLDIHHRAADGIEIGRKTAFEEIGDVAPRPAADAPLAAGDVRDTALSLGGDRPGQPSVLCRSPPVKARGVWHSPQCPGPSTR